MNKEKLPRLMIATGDDNFAMDLSKDKYFDQVKAARGEYITDMFDPANERISDFLARAMTPSLFQEIRVFCVLHAQALTESDLGALDKILDHEIPDVYIFISAEIDKKAAGSTKVSKCLQTKKRAEDKSVSVLDFSRPPDYKLAEWIMQQASAFFNRQISLPDAEFLAEVVEYDLIYSELQKIDLALPSGARIDKGVIQEIAGVTRAMSVYELASALGKKDLPAALQVIDSLFTGTFYAPLAVSAVFKHFWSLMKIKKYLEKNPAVLRQFNSRGFGKDSPQSVAAFEIGLACGLLTEKDKAKNKAFPVIIKSGIVQQSQSFTEKGLREILKTLQRFDVDVKTGRTESVPYNLQMLCYRIVRAA